MVANWAHYLMKRCDTEGIPFFMKQMGSVNDRDYKSRGIKLNMDWGYIPKELRVREWPLTRDTYVE